MASLLAEQLVTLQHQSVHGLEPEHQTVRQQGKSEVGKMLYDQMIISVDSFAAVMSDGDTVMKIDGLGDTVVCAVEHQPAGELELGFFSWLTTDQMFAARKITSSLFFLPFVSSSGFALTPVECFYSVKHNRTLTADDTSGKCNNKTQK